MEDRSSRTWEKGPPESLKPPSSLRNPIRWLYNWVLHWAETPYGVPALALLAFAESSFFPIPPDVLLIALAISIPKRSFQYALICTLASILGGCFGYLLGAEFFHPLVNPVIEFFGLSEKWFGFPLEGQSLEKIIKGYFFYPNGLFWKAWEWFNQYGFLAIFLAALTPIPYKVFTISAGFFEVGLDVLILGSILGRSFRFFGVALLIYFLGPSIRIFIDKYFNILTILFAILLIGGFLLIGRIL